MERGINSHSEAESSTYGIHPYIKKKGNIGTPTATTSSRGQPYHQGFAASTHLKKKP
jgi:hypothetical protein